MLGDMGALGEEGGSDEAAAAWAHEKLVDRDEDDEDVFDREAMSDEQRRWEAECTQEREEEMVRVELWQAGERADWSEEFLHDNPCAREVEMRGPHGGRDPRLSAQSKQAPSVVPHRATGRPRAKHKDRAESAWRSSIASARSTLAEERDGGGSSSRRASISSEASCSSSTSAGGGENGGWQHSRWWRQQHVSARQQCSSGQLCVWGRPQRDRGLGRGLGRRGPGCPLASGVARGTMGGAGLAAGFEGGRAGAVSRQGPGCSKEVGAPVQAGSAG